ncbi:GCN5-related protein N-acetyltransferase [Beutenbergia cavernae DSM 12333]|uniref:GCN5-related protein N-acetyltransferase n=1 Tax=Beutenbergia cavernae (strain ATCC BAA-8 / DSM 12333 / CCUG 43141 / JCM 11478 / NBRC 16432 / NCIMB 13614 / HKI 0122) TaxID=471853 RepID=C5BVP7_BEUC1|nr:GNAT family N-acetyltransferase [Beutenbergia cavernae]ACQ78487.1 GCN5-related protein N-acetyltransferase [Beutenbergia cavernae DSM 12333]
MTPTTRTTSASDVVVRPYTDDDGESWMRCRLLAFAHTQYYDDVRISPALDGPALRIVAEVRGDVVGLLDIEIDAEEHAATIDSVAVLPDHAGRGIASRMLDAALPLLGDGIATLDAWTREDAAANAWYGARGFTERFRYLHVYKGWDDPADGFTTPDGLSRPVTAFLHADIEREAELRERFSRVYVCRQYVRALSAPRARA